jgi:hypothetical protein
MVWPRGSPSLFAKLIPNEWVPETGLAYVIRER